MKNNITKIVAAVCIVFMMVGFAGAYAKDNAEVSQLYQKYGYNEAFEYNATTIGFAMRTTVPLISTTVRGTVEYQPVVFDEEGFLETFQSLRYEYGVETEEQERTLISLLLEDLKTNTARYLSYGSEKTVEAENGVTGSGVVLSEDGYIATNSHVVSPDDETKALIYFMAIQEGVVDDLAAIIADIEEYGVEFTDEETESLYNLVVQASAERMDVADEEISWEVYFPTSDGKTGVEDAVVYEATVEAEGTQYDMDGNTQDAAIIKIDADNLVALRLSEDYPDLNESIVSAGFPGKADVIFKEGGSTESTLSIFSSVGTVSRLVPFKGTEYQSIGIDSTISGGSSGGPSVDMRLNVEGLNTFGVTDDMRFAYMVPAAFVRDLAEGIKLEQGDVTKTFLTGLQLLQNNYGPAALECFKSVEKSRPDTPYIAEMIKKAENAPGNKYPGQGEDGKSDNGFLAFLKKNWIFIVGGAIVLIAIVIIVIVCVKKKKKKAVKTKEDYAAGSEVPMYANDENVYDVPHNVQKDGYNNNRPPAVNKEYEAFVPTVTQNDGTYNMGQTTGAAVGYQPSAPAAEATVIQEKSVDASLAEKPGLRSTMRKPKEGALEGRTDENIKPVADEAFSPAKDLE